MNEPFRITGPAVISFSGGRTSGYMLRRCLGLSGNMDADTFVLFANTGKERPETLDFVAACESYWGVPIVWLERPPGGGFQVVTFDTASREGQPFDALIEQRGYLPNPVTRFCTQELKIRVMRDYMRSRGYDYWTNVVGIRADEPRRVQRMRAQTPERWTIQLPLADAGVTVERVMSFWAAQVFDLQLASHEGNCDLCFLKGQAKRLAILRQRPDLATWWIDHETRTGNTFRSPDRPTYAALLQEAIQQPRLDFDLEADGWDEDAVAECYCHD